MPQQGEFRVSVSKDDLVFSSAHFITYAGHRCEGLHGHNYHARVAVDGQLDPADKLVFDFLELKRIMRRLCGEIDHLVLLPLESARIQVEAGDASCACRWMTNRAMYFRGAIVRSCLSPTQPWRCSRNCWPPACMPSSTRLAPVG